MAELPLYIGCSSFLKVLKWIGKEMASPPFSLCFCEVTLFLLLVNWLFVYPFFSYQPTYLHLSLVSF